LPGFDKAITFASFQDNGKCDSYKQWLSRWVRWTIGFRGSCPRHLLGMLSIPQAFHNLRVYYFLYITRPYSFQRIVVYSLKQGLDAGHYQLFVMFLAQVMWWELGFQTVSTDIGCG
jgi:hypothetical protein